MRTQQYAYKSASIGSGVNSFKQISIGEASASSTDAADSATTVKRVGVYSNLYLRVSSNTTTAAGTGSFNKSSVPQAQAVSITLGAANQAFEDTTHQDVVADSDVINVQMTGGTGGSTGREVWGDVFNATGLTSALVGAFNRNAVGANDVKYFRWVSQTGSTTELASYQMQQQTGAVLRYGNAAVISNSRATNASTWSPRFNGATTGTIVVSISPGAGTGQFLDTSGSDTVAVNDTLDVICSNGSGTGTAAGLYVFSFETTDGTLMHATAGAGDKTYNANTSTFECVNARMEVVATETSTYGKVVAPAIASNGAVYVVTDTVTNASTITYRANGAPTVIAVSVPGSSGAGWYNDTTHVAVLIAPDTINWNVATGNAGTSLVMAMMGNKMLMVTPPLPSLGVG